MQAPISCVYELDADLRIVSVDAGWINFAMENQAPELVPPSGPLGQLVMACVTDATIAHLYGRLFQRVLETRRAASFPFRCDSPALRRFMELSISPRDPSGLRVETRLVRTEARTPVALLEHPTGGESEDFLVMCAWCKLVDVEGRWCEVEDALGATRVFERDLLPRITHGMCPSCSGRMHHLLDAK